MRYVHVLCIAACIAVAATCGRADELEPERKEGWLCDTPELFKEFSFELDKGGSKPWAALLVNIEAVDGNECDYFDYEYYKVRPVALINTNGVVEEVWEIDIVFLVAASTRNHFHPRGFDGQYYMYGAFENTGSYAPIPVPRPVMETPAATNMSDSDTFPDESSDNTVDPPEVELSPPEYKFRI